MGQEINQKSHDSAIFDIIVLLTKEHHTLLRHNESTRRERRKTISGEKKFHKKKERKKSMKQKHKSNKRKTEPPPLPPLLIRLTKKGVIGKIDPNQENGAITTEKLMRMMNIILAEAFSVRPLNEANE